MQKPREMLLSAPAGKKKKVEGLPRAQECADPRPRPVFGRPSRVDLLSVLSKSTHTKRDVRKQTKK